MISIAAKYIINSHYALPFRKFSRASQSVHVHTLCCAGSIQDSFFRLRSLVIFGISAVHLAQLGNKQRWHMYFVLSLNIASSFGFKAVGFCLQSDDLHVNPRQILHVVHAGLLHAGCEQSKHLTALCLLLLFVQSSRTIFPQSLHLINHEFVVFLHE